MADVPFKGYNYFKTKSIYESKVASGEVEKGSLNLIEETGEMLVFNGIFGGKPGIKAYLVYAEGELTEEQQAANAAAYASVMADEEAIYFLDQAILGKIPVTLVMHMLGYAIFYMDITGPDENGDIASSSIRIYISEDGSLETDISTELSAISPSLEKVQTLIREASSIYPSEYSDEFNDDFTI